MNNPRPCPNLLLSSRRKLWLPPFLVFLAGVAGGLYWLSFGSVPQAAGNGQPDASEWIPVRRGDFEVLWRDEGELRPVKVTALSFLHYGKLSYIIPEGTSVKKDDRLLSQETTDLEDQYQRSQEDLTTEQKDLTEQQQNRTLETKRLDTELQAERDRVNVARLKEQEVLNKPTDLDKSGSINALETARTHLGAAQADYNAFAPLAEKGYGNKGDLESKRLALQQAEIEVQRAEMKNKMCLAGALPEDKRRATLDRENAELGLKLKEADVADQLDNLTAKVTAAQRDVDATLRKLDNLKDRLDSSTVYAPHAGIVVYRLIGHGNKKVEVGENVGPWASPIEIPNYEIMKVRTKVPESFVRRLQARAATATDGKPPRAGSPARVMLKTLPDRVYDAEVIWIDGWARDKNAKLSDADIKAQGLSGVRVFDVEVELKESDPQHLREGFRATVEFPVETLHDVISVPIRAIISRDGKPFVQVRRGDAASLRPVELGTKSMDRVVVLSGLGEDDVVYVPKAKQREVQHKSGAPSGAPGAAAGPASTSTPGSAVPADASNGTKSGGTKSNGTKPGGGSTKSGGGRHSRSSHGGGTRG